jgi:hypothetical protein
MKPGSSLRFWKCQDQWFFDSESFFKNMNEWLLWKSNTHPSLVETRDWSAIFQLTSLYAAKSYEQQHIWPEMMLSQHSEQSGIWGKWYFDIASQVMDANFVKVRHGWLVFMGVTLPAFWQTDKLVQITWMKWKLVRLFRTSLFHFK